MKLSRRELRRLIEQEVKIITLSPEEKAALEKERKDASDTEEKIAKDIADREDLNKDDVKKALSEIFKNKLYEWSESGQEVSDLDEKRKKKKKKKRSKKRNTYKMFPFIYGHHYDHDQDSDGGDIGGE